MSSIKPAFQRTFIGSSLLQIKRLPNADPTLAITFTGLMAMGCLLNGIAITVSGFFAVGISLMVIGFTLLMLIAYAAYDIHFHYGSYRDHHLIRQVGPFVLLFGLVGLAFVFGFLLLLLNKLFKGRWFPFP